MEIRQGAGVTEALDPILTATVAEAQSITAVKRTVRDFLGRVDYIDVGTRSPVDGGAYTMDSRLWPEDDAADIDFKDFKSAAPQFAPGMVLDLYCYAMEIAGKPEYGGNLIGNVELRLEGASE